MQGLREVKTHPSVRLALSIANTEACLSGSQCIEMIHLLHAILNIVDDHYDQAAQSIGLSPAELKSVAEIATHCRERLNISNERITAIRRQLHNVLTSGESRAPIMKLSCSNDSMYLIQKAARRSHNHGAAELDLLFVLEELLADLPEEIAPYFRADDNNAPTLSK